MNELEDILGIKFPSNCEVSSVTNTSKKVKRNPLNKILFRFSNSINGVNLRRKNNVRKNKSNKKNKEIK